MQVLVMTSDVSAWTLAGFAHQFNKYWGLMQEVTICGFSEPPLTLPHNFHFHSLGAFADYPPNRWSDAFLKVLEQVAEEVFVLLLDDYWLVRKVDVPGVQALYDYARQFQSVLKIDLCFDRLNNDPGRYHFGAHTYDHCGHLDLLKSPGGSSYQLSLWGGIWRRDVLQRFIIPGERAQEIEIEGTRRVNAWGEQGPMVLGTRQGPVLHGNLIQSRDPGKLFLEDNGWRINAGDQEALRELGYLDRPVPV